MRAFSSALDAVPLALAENSGLSPIETLTEVRSRQIKENDSKLGIDCNGRGQNGLWFSHDTAEHLAKRVYRHEGAVRVRPTDLQTATVPVGDSVGTGGVEDW